MQKRGPQDELREAKDVVGEGALLFRQKKRGLWGEKDPSKKNLDTPVGKRSVKPIGGSN